MIGIDIGTTSVKTVLYDTAGKVLGYSNNLYPLYQDQPDMAEEDPEEIFRRSGWFNSRFKKS